MVDFEDLTDEQQRAADALDRNVSLTAGAGTGKTTTLTQRYVRMLERGLDDEVPEDPEAPLTPDQIVTTTFTERAANELKANVREAINERVEDSDAATYRQWREIADGLDEGYIHTLHGFCARLLREHALSASTVDPGFDTLEEHETRALLEDTVAAVLETHDDHEAVRTLSRQFDRNGLQAVLVDLLQERPGCVTWAKRWADATEADYLEFVNEELHPVSPSVAAERFADPTFCEAVAAVEALVNSPPAALETGGQAWGRALDVLECLDGVDYASGRETLEVRDSFVILCDQLTTGSGDEYSSYTGAKGRWSGADEEKAVFDDAMQTIVDVVEPADHLVSGSIEADKNSVPFVRALAQLALIAHEEYTERKRRRNVVDFTDQIEFALQFLCEEASEDLRAQLREQFAYLMVDEFQDTDPRQWELVKHLTAPNPEAFDAQNVFVVGDAKQSIYRFRNADVTQFDATEAELERANPPGAVAGEDDQLSTNFRTLPDVLAFVNEVFDEVFEADGPAYEAAPQRLEAHRDDPADLAGMEYLAVPTDEDYRARRFADDHEFATARVEHDAELEGMALAARLTQLFDEPAQIYDEDGDVDDSEPRDVEPDDVAILLRSRTHLKRYERALEAEHIPFTVASGVGFYETTEVTALVNLLKALADPADERALYGALRSPLFGLSDDTLALLKRDGEALWDALGEADQEELADAYGLLSAWRSRAGLGPDPEQHLDGSWAAFLSQIIADTGYLASVSADERGRQAVANVDKFREQLRAYTEDGVTSLATLVDRIERQRDLGGGEGEATIQGGGDGVQILTVHDAKGMEFPVVVVPGLDKGFNMRAAVGDGRVEFEEVDDEAYAVGLKAPDPDDPFDMTGTIAREALKERRRAEERAEEKRVLYVACTRARDRLLLSGTHDLDGDGDEVLTMTDVKDGDPEEAGSWRDWVQPHVLTDTVLEALEERDRITKTVGDASVTISLPTPAADWTGNAAAPDLQLELSETPSQPPRQFYLTPTDLASLFDGWGSLVVDEWTNTVRYQSEEETDASGTGEEAGPPDDLESTVFGEMVHRLCELRPPSDQWDAVIERTHEAEDSEVELTDAMRQRVRDHASRAMEFVDGLHERHEVAYTYDELSVTASFDHGEVSGLIDHLVVTPDAYHVVDYKTNDITEAEVEEKAEYYRTQLEAYAIALHQQDSNRDVLATLYFTSPEVPHEFEWDADELNELRSKTVDRIASELDTLESR
ncbi:UvrD-helicase domain-containing protein [Natronomonas salina]|uniref:UvrD-helicase domain-containing protein n=1 Tax=Natronomonas salina TaxID=1710540 RepID=UPI0015B4D9F6|nr:UvrD-helicase domain-containing protein [Natronomonas salina]QLD89114.1 UvrD-helicase domain-containing protein [Natronomonas salina]